MSILVKQSEIDDVSCVIEGEGGVSKVISYRYYSDSKVKKVPKYVREGSQYLLIQGGGLVSADDGLYSKIKGKGYVSNHSDYKMVDYEEMQRKSIVASCSNPKRGS